MAVTEDAPWRLTRVETEDGELAALLEVVVAPSRLDADDALP